MTTPRLLRVRQVAEICGVSSPTVNKWRRTGIVLGGKRRFLNYVKYGEAKQSEVRIPQEWLEEFLAEMGYVSKRPAPKRDMREYEKAMRAMGHKP